MFQLSEGTKAIIERNTGVTMGELVRADDVDQIIIVESKLNAPLFFFEGHDTGRIGRGNPLLARKKYRTIDEVHRRIDAIIKK